MMKTEYTGCGGFLQMDGGNTKSMQKRTVPKFRKQKKETAQICSRRYLTEII